MIIHWCCIGTGAGYVFQNLIYAIKLNRLTRLTHKCTLNKHNRTVCLFSRLSPRSVALFVTTQSLLEHLGIQLSKRTVERKRSIRNDGTERRKTTTNTPRHSTHLALLLSCFDRLHFHTLQLRADILVSGVQCDRILQVGFCLLELTQSSVGLSATEQRLDVARINFQGLRNDDRTSEQTVRGQPQTVTETNSTSVRTASQHFCACRGWLVLR